MGRKRFYYPGGNTSKGFYSYYDYILSQAEAKKIYCMKGGPGTGKSTFMREIGDELFAEGYDIDYLMCSSDPGSLDGIVVKEKKIAIIDGTAPHIVDPKTPGAVDVIINMGEFWDEEEIRKNKKEILITGNYVKECFEKAYKYIERAAEIYQGLEGIYSAATKNEEIYKTTAGLVNKELAHKELSASFGAEKKFFASAITPEGIINQISSLTENCSNVYILKAPVGVSGRIILDGFKYNARLRGLEVETFYCPLSPENRPEHVIVPEINLAIVTSNDYHSINQLAASVIDLRLFIDYEYIEKHRNLINRCEEEIKALLERAVDCLKDAKAGHDMLEEMYIPYMKFDEIEKKRKEVLNEIKKFF